MNWKYYDPKFEYEEAFQDAGWPWAGHKFFAYDLTRNFKPEVIVELGTHKGTSLFSFCQAVKDGKIDSVLFAVDTWKGDDQAGFYDKDVYKEVEDVRKKYYGDLKINLFRTTFDEASKDFKENTIDLLHIDGLHTYKAVKHDFTNWLSKVKDDGIIIMHDISEKHDDFGVYKLWDEIKKKHETLEFHHSHGLGIMFKKNNKNKNLFIFQDIWQHYYPVLVKKRTLEIEMGQKPKLLNLIQKKEEEVSSKENKIVVLNRNIKNLEEMIENKKEIIKETRKEIKEYATIVQDRENQLNAIVNTLRWKVPNYIYKFYKFRLKQFRLAHVKELIENTQIILKREGLIGSVKSLVNYFQRGQGYFKKSQKFIDQVDYENWIMKNERLDKIKIASKIENFEYQPKISIIMPVFDADEIFLRKAIFSIIYQYYQNWELIIVDNSSQKRIIRKILADFQKRDRRIKTILFDNKRGTSEILNDTTEKSSGEFIAVMGQEDELTPDALYRNVKLLNKNNDFDVIYSDEDLIDENGSRFNPNFKPDWSPELALSTPYIGQLKVLKRELFLGIGGYQKNFGLARDYDLVLRISERSKKIAHIPKILYHKRKHPYSEARYAKEYPQILSKMKQSLQEFIKRNGINAKALIPDFAKKVNDEVCSINFDSKNFSEKVTIIIPTKDRIDLLKRCIESIKEKTNYKNYKILVINNNSKEKSTFDYLKARRINYLTVPTAKFNFSKINNIAVSKANTELVLLLNNDTEVISPDWLIEMAGTMSLSDKIGAVGAKLIYGDNRVQHAGVILGLSELTASHANKMIHCDDCGYQNYNLVMRNYSAVTAACMLTKKSLYEKVGGLDEKNLAVQFNDVDYCLKLLTAGYRIVYNPNALLHHHEQLSRKSLEYDMEEVDFFRKKWDKLIKNDPFYNPNLSLENERFEIKKN